MSFPPGSPMMRRVLFLLMTLLSAGRICVAGPFIERVWPPVLQRGITTRVEFSGTELQQPFGVWTSVPDGNVTGIPTGNATEDTVSVDITVPASAPLGLYGLRLATASGLSNAHLFLI